VIFIADADHPVMSAFFLYFFQDSIWESANLKAKRKNVTDDIPKANPANTSVK